MGIQPRTPQGGFALLWFIFGCSTGLACAGWFIGYSHKPAIIKTLSGQFADHTTGSRLFLLQPKIFDITANFIVIYQKQGDGFIKTWHSPAAPIWDMSLGDVDGDGGNELALCLRKRESRDPKNNNRLHIYAWGKTGLYAKWRGTFLCHPFYQTYLMDLDNDGKSELVSLEKHTEQKLLCIYRWNGFGFDLAAKSTLKTATSRLYHPRGYGKMNQPNIRSQVYVEAQSLFNKDKENY